MKEKTKKQLKRVWTIVLIVMVSGIYAYRKYYRKEIRRKAQFEQNEALMERSTAQQQKEREALFIEQRNKQNSTLRAKQKELDSLKRAAEEILKQID